MSQWLGQVDRHQFTALQRIRPRHMILGRERHNPKSPRHFSSGIYSTRHLDSLYDLEYLIQCKRIRFPGKIWRSTEHLAVAPCFAATQPAISIMRKLYLDDVESNCLS